MIIHKIRIAILKNKIAKMLNLWHLQNIHHLPGTVYTTIQGYTSVMPVNIGIVTLIYDISNIWFGVRLPVLVVSDHILIYQELFLS